MRHSNLVFRSHLTILGLLVALPFVGAGAAISALYARAQTANTEQQLASTAKEISQSIDRHIEGIIASLRALSFSPQLRSGDYGGFHEQARRTAETFTGVVVVLRTADGRQLVNSQRRWGTPLPQTSDPVLRAADALALEGDRTVISDLFIGNGTRQFNVAVEFAVRADGTVFLLSAAIAPEAVLQLLQSSTALKPNWRLVVLDRQHHVISRTLQHAQYVGRQASPEFAARITGREGTLDSTTLDGAEVANGYYRSPLTGWTTVVSIEADAFYEPLRASLMAVASISVTGLLLSVLLAVLYSRYVTPPIWRLRDEARALAAGREVPPFNTGIAELNAVSDALAESSQALAEERRSNVTLVNELNHRVKNTLATVQAIAAQTLRGARVDPAVGQALEARLMALSGAHSTLTAQNWEGADLRQVVAQAVAPHATSDRVTLEGPPLQLPPRPALAIAMVVHELATNAVKYGAFSTAAGRVAVSWRVESEAPQTLILQWQERGGPPVDEPSRRGFGSRLIERLVAHDLGGSASLRFAPDGLTCIITAVLGRPPQPDAQPQAQRQPQPQEQPEAETAS